jgi:hypothetical protein
VRQQLVDVQADVEGPLQLDQEVDEDLASDLPQPR